MSDKRRVSAHIDEDVVEALDEVGDEYSLSRSRVIRDVLVGWLDDADASIEDAIPEATRELAIKQRKHDRMMDRQRLREQRASWRDRIRGHFEDRIEGSEAYDPDDMADLAEGYRTDAEIWIDDDDRVDDAHDQVDEWLAWYRAGYWAREHADAIDTEVQTDDVSGWFDAGRDVYRLRSRIDEVEAHIRDVADGDAFDADAVVASVAAKWSVSEGVVRLLIELMIDDPDASINDAIRLGGETIGSASTAAGRLTSGSDRGSGSTTPAVGDGGRDVEDDSAEDDDVVVVDGVELPPDAERVSEHDRRSEPDEVAPANGAASRLDGE